MKKLVKNIAEMGHKRDRETGLNVWDIIKFLPAVAAAVFLLGLVTKWIGFAAAFGTVMIPALAIAAAACFYMER